MYDRVLQSQAYRAVIVNQIETALAKGIDIAQEKVINLSTVYEKLQSISKSDDVLKNFIPASETSNTATPEEGKQKKVMTRIEYNNLAPRDRLAFAKAGGTLEGE